ncbi:DNA alkylation repair protein [Ruminococcus sp.]|uniref:DNA alkylation repair protein n=1 Tax=Ruminococcus sp. TaxID=41978 RepID=UPI0025DE4E65|nr:DNA alkylation repair protein [Ruminococcus sp.]MBQ8967384.1 DNA alkylation repair protein [Ruminococcus sp.]
MDIRHELEKLGDEKYREFQRGLIPDVAGERFLGVRTPEIRRLAKVLLKEGQAEGFLERLPHELFDEDQLHGLILSEMKGFEKVLGEVERFLPYVNNWATCDQLRPKAFKGEQKRLLPRIEAWLDSGECYKVRFGMEMLMLHFLGEHFSERHLRRVAEIKSGEYYVKMMQAWFFAEALALRYEEALPYIAKGRLEVWVNNKAVQKACESLKISADRKAVLRGYRRKITK